MFRSRENEGAFKNVRIGNYRKLRPGIQRALP
jgi:hypothetical protein